MADLDLAVETLAEAVELARGFVPEPELEPAASLAVAVQRRHGFLGETVVVALAGGTGSGKSSLLNALAGEVVSSVGAVRPTTAEPLAWTPANPEPSLTRLLDEFGIERRVGHALELPVAVVDLPDYDSIELDHRAVVEALLPRVDAVIWVLDPQKYSDRALHRHYLVPLVAYQAQFLFVLNQADRLEGDGLEAVLGDLTERLHSEGFSDPRIITTAAAPVAGAPRGIDTLVAAMTERLEAKRTVHAKLVEDLRRSHQLLLESSGLARASRGEFTEGWESAKRVAVDGLTDLVAGGDAANGAQGVGERLATSRAAGPVGRLGALVRRSRLGRALGAAPDEVVSSEWWARPGLERVLGELSRTVTDLSTDVGGGLGARLRREFGPERLDGEIRSAVEAARHEVGDLGPPQPRRWWTLVGVLQLLLFATLIVGAVWTWVDGVDRGQVPWNLILVGGSVMAAAILSWGVRASGRRAGRRMAATYRASMDRSIAVHLQQRVGDGVTGVIEVRNRLETLLDRLESQIANSAQALMP